MSALGKGGRPSFLAEIRAAIESAPDGMTCAQVKTLFPGKNIPVALGAMYRKGMLTRTGAERHYVYFVARKVAARTMGLSREAMRARRQALQRQQYAEMSPEEHAAYLATKRERRQAARPVARSPRKRAPARPVPVRAVQQAPRVGGAAPRSAMVIAPPSAESYTARPPAPKPVAETVEQWRARTGREPEQLPGFQQVKPYTSQPIRGF